MMMLRGFLLLLAAATSTHGLSTVVPATTTTTSVYEGLASTPLLRASDGRSVLLTDQWRSSTLLGLGDETAVCAFLRHYG